MAIDILAAGMVSAVGFNAPASCAAIRCNLDGFTDTRFAHDGEWLQGAQVLYPDALRGRAKLLRMAVAAIDECLAAASPAQEGDTGLILCLAEPSRPGRTKGLDDGFFAQVRAQLAVPRRLGRALHLVQSGRMGPVEALQLAEQWIANQHARFVVVASVDSLLTRATIDHYHGQRRLLTADNEDGFIPGEAAAAVLVGPASMRGNPLQLLGVGEGHEAATLDAEHPLRGDGSAHAYRAAFAAAGCGFEHLDYRMTDISGEQYAFRDAALALLRTMRVRKASFQLWHPAECVGEVGAAAVPIMLAVALAAARKGYAPGPGVLLHAADDQGRRAAAVVREYGKPSNPSF
jgi:3-oxoacyl-[acyl-carrier-protein] synthase-1